MGSNPTLSARKDKKPLISGAFCAIDGKPQYVRNVIRAMRVSFLAEVSSIAGLTYHEAADGAACNRDGDAFRIVETGQRLTMRQAPLYFEYVTYE